LEQWRFIDSGHADGFSNMAIDLALARCSRGTPVLRVYGWKPPAISLGHHQRLSDLDLEKCHRAGIDVVYRPTGGRAVLHADEVTYAVILGPESSLHHSRILPVYERISQGILAALLQLQIPLDFERAPRPAAEGGRSELSRLCFASSIQYEIGHAGKKMIGSAQRRFGDIVLQHGSILLGREHLQLVDYLAQREGGREEEWQQGARRFMQEKTICLNDLAPAPLDYAMVTAALREGFASHWRISFTDSALTAEESATAATLREEMHQKTVSGKSREQ
jgi:lipoyl(octanoyl) transferase